jgi:hypothetical protein
MRHLVKLALALLLAACSQSYEDGVRVLCDAPTHCMDNRDAADRAVCVGEWTRDHVKNDQVRKDISAMAVMEGPRPGRTYSKLDVLRAMLKQAGIVEAQCAAIDLWTVPAAQPPAK